MRCCRQAAHSVTAWPHESASAVPCLHSLSTLPWKLPSQRSMASTDGERVALITGATGITGRHCVDACLRAGGWRVVTIARRDLQGLSAEDAGRVTQASERRGVAEPRR